MQLERTEACARKLDEEDPLAGFREEFALVLIGSVGYATGRAFDIGAITEAGHGKGCREVLARLAEEGVTCDFREPDLLRVAPVPRYNRFLDVYRFVQILEEVL